MASAMESNIDHHGTNELGSLEFGGVGGGNMLNSGYAEDKIEPENDGVLYQEEAAVDDFNQNARQNSLQMMENMENQYVGNNEQDFV